MSEWLILIFVLYIIYLIMKKPKTTTEKPVPETKAEQPIAAVETKTTPKKPGPDLKTPKKAQAVVPKPVAATPEPVAVTPEIPMSERVGLTAGNLWHYLSENGATSVAKLVRELPEEEKIIQRGIGWLAQEGKITLAVVDRVETLALKD